MSSVAQLLPAPWPNHRSSIARCAPDSRSESRVWQLPSGHGGARDRLERGTSDREKCGSRTFWRASSAWSSSVRHPGTPMRSTWRRNTTWCTGTRADLCSDSRCRRTGTDTDEAGESLFYFFSPRIFDTLIFLTASLSRTVARGLRIWSSERSVDSKMSFVEFNLWSVLWTSYISIW